MSEFEIPLPKVREGYRLELKHFPTIMQAFVFRNWEMVPVKRIALVLNTSEKNILKLSEDMGLPPQKNTDDWLKKGYITIIRSNWHILPYNQLLTLLNWDKEKLAYVLKEDDFLGYKLGNFKFDCNEVTYRELTKDEQEKTAEIKAVMMEYIRCYDAEDKTRPFDLFCLLESKTETKNEKPNDCNMEITTAWRILDNTKASETDFFIKMFTQDYNLAWGLDVKQSEKMDDPHILLTISDRFVNKNEEYHEIKIMTDKIEITAAAPVGILRGLTRLEDMAKTVGGPYYKTGTYKFTPRIKTRYIYSYCGLYGNAFDEKNDISYPDSLLRSYAKLGINGIFNQAVLYKMVRFPFEPSLSLGWQNRLNNLSDLVKRAKKYGIKVYLYINEPRAMPLNFYEKYPDLKGHVNGEYACLCTSAPEVQQYLSEAIEKICSTVPDLGGFFTIVRSENLTNCFSHAREDNQDCPRCKNRKIAEVIAELNSIISVAAKRVNSKIITFAMTWAWFNNGMKNEEDMELCLNKMDESIPILNVSEDNLEYTIGGISDKVIDYSMSLIGPSRQSINIWSAAKRKGHEMAAKVQINNTWECSTTPYIPVYESIMKHMQNLMEAGVEHLMLSWTLGGYPSVNLKIASSYFFEADSAKINYDNILKSIYGNDYLTVKKAVSKFCEAFSEYPFHVGTIYVSPTNSGMSNLLYEKPTGLHATMTCYSYDDIEAWRSIYPVNIFEEQFKLVSEKWAEGLNILKEYPSCEFLDVATICGAIFKSTYNQIRFVQQRDHILKNVEKKDISEILKILEDEIELAVTGYTIMLRNPTIGYEAANHYYYNRSMLMEKVINCKYLLKKFTS